MIRSGGQRTVTGMAVLCSMLLCSTALADLAVRDLRCEYERNPIGMDVGRPRLSWVIESDQRGTMQASYEVLVATSEEKLKGGAADLWDSGATKSDQSIQVVYGGKELASRQRAYWKVIVSDNHGNTAESPVAFFEMGLLRPRDWNAQWISVESGGTNQDTLGGVAWIWFDEGNPAASAPAGQRFFRRTFEIPADARITSATYLLTVDDQFTLYVNGQEAGKSSGVTDAWKQPQRLNVTKFLSPGKNVIAIAATNSAASPAGVFGRLDVRLNGGRDVSVLTGSSGWKSARQKQDGWEKADFDDSQWAGAKELGKYGMGPWNQFAGGSGSPGCRYLRKDFSLGKEIRQARLYASALGVYEIAINGQRVGDQIFAPGWTDYYKRVHYQTYDVTKLLKQSENAIGITLGDGWFCGFVGLGGRNRYPNLGTLPLAICQLEVTFADGSTQTIATDSSWKGTLDGPIVNSDMLMGETYDARKEMPGWDKAGFNDSNWKRVVSREVKSPLQAQVGPPVRKMQELKAKTVSEPVKGKFVFDLGQNMVGWVRLKVKGEAGQTVTIRFAERLNPDGTIYTTNYRGAKSTDYYTLKGGGEEVYEPTFTFHGFQYVEISGVQNTPALDAVTGIVVHSDTPWAGKFECSNPMVNQLQSNITWGQRGNFLAVPTDCPQRDERLGWMGDAQIFIRTATYNMDVASFFTKWTVDVDDAQTAEGAYPDVAPRVAAGAGTAAWADAGVICPWTVYQVYGDTRIIEQHFDHMAKWVEYVRRNNPDLIWLKARNSDYGDWLSINANTPKEVLATAYFAYSARLLSKMAAAVGREEDAKKYEDLFQQIKAAFNKAFVSEDARIKGNTQTCYVIALRFDLLPDDKRAAAADHLVQDIKQKGWHLSTGFVGVGYLLPTLTRMNDIDIAYGLLLQDTFPSWFYSIKQGATTIWERWDGWTKEKGFQDPGMNSFNHYSLGSVGEWLYEAVAGIDLDPAKPGFKHIIVRPRLGGQMNYAKGEYNSMHGKIASSWKLENGAFSLDVTIPANTTATIYVPNANNGTITEGGKPIDQAAGVKPAGNEGGAAKFEVGSGTYRFAVK